MALWTSEAAALLAGELGLVGEILLPLPSVPERVIVLSLRPDAAHTRIRCPRTRIRAARGYLDFLSRRSVHRDSAFSRSHFRFAAARAPLDRTTFRVDLCDRSFHVCRGRQLDLQDVRHHASR